MRKTAFRNTSNRTQIVGGVTVPAGSTRQVPAYAVKAAAAPAEPTAAPDPDAARKAAALASATVDEVVAELPNLTPEQLAEVQAAETAGKARKGILSAIAEELIRRAGGGAAGEQKPPTE